MSLKTAADFRKTGITLLAGLIFVLALYVLPLALVLRYMWIAFPYLGPQLSFIVVCMGLFVAFWFLLKLWMKYLDDGPFRLSPAVQSLQRQTGLAKYDWFMFPVALACTSYLLLSGAWLLLPLGLVSLAVFWRLTRASDSSSWPVKIYARALPSQLPPLRPGVEGEGKQVLFHWMFPRAAAQAGIGKLKMFIRSADHAAARATNASAGPRRNELLSTAESRAALVNQLVHPQHDREVLTIAHYVHGQNLSLYEQLCCLLALVQSIPYKGDEETTGYQDYWRFPVETLYDGAGDCDDKAVLLCAIFKMLFLSSPDPANNLDIYFLLSFEEQHASVAIGGPNAGLPADLFKIGDDYFYFCEATSDGKVGTIPAGLDITKYEFIKILPGYES